MSRSKRTGPLGCGEVGPSAATVRSSAPAHAMANYQGSSMSVKRNVLLATPTGVEPAISVLTGSLLGFGGGAIWWESPGAQQKARTESR